MVGDYTQEPSMSLINEPAWLPKGRDLVRQIIASSNSLTDAMVRTAGALSNEISSIFNRNWSSRRRQIQFWTTRSLALGVVQDQSSRKPCYENEHNNLKEPHGEKIVVVTSPIGIETLRDWVPLQPGDQLQQSFNLKPGIEQINHLLQREPGLSPAAASFEMARTNEVFSIICPLPLMLPEDRIPDGVGP
jgi:hypothetical protein